MKKIFKLLSVLCIVLIISIQQCGAKDFSDKIVTVIDIPQITFVGVGHSPLIEGDTENFLITTKVTFDLKVKYRVFLHDDTRNTKLELTSGYTELVDPNVPYEIKPSYIFQKGKYRVEIWVKTEGSVSEYDNTYTANLNCVNRDNKNRVYANGDMVIDKDTYNVGEKVVVQGIKNIGGITGPYKYRLHIFSPNKIGVPGYGFDNSGWAKNVTRYADTIEWIPQEPGTYVLDAHIITPNSILWKNVQKNQDIIYGGYEAWKLKTITVLPKDVVQENNVFTRSDISTISNYNQYAVINNVLVLKDKYDFASSSIKPNYTTSTAYNPSLKTNFYDIVNSLAKPGMYTELSYADGSRRVNYVSCANIIYQKTKERNDINDFAFLYSFYTDDKAYIDTQKAPLVYLGYKPLGRIGVGTLISDENNVNSFYKSNKIIFGEYGDAISKMIVDNCKLHINDSDEYMERKYFGNYMINQSYLNGYANINFLIKE